ncbi:MAG: hypothetical protein GY725_00135 [bacterium]|nr:hypothetical protein [bacterium]
MSRAEILRRADWIDVSHGVRRFGASRAIVFIGWEGPLEGFFPLKKSDAIIFDLDGTLWDASHFSSVGWNAALGACGISAATVSQEDMQALATQSGAAGVDYGHASYGFGNGLAWIMFGNVQT